jgi:acyl-coenzyme A synthetase/AMP-(fatty) acid ligase
MDGAIGSGPGIWLAVTSISFDISVLELFWTLARGFHVILQAEADKLAVEGDYSIWAQVARYRISHLQCTPSMARFLVSAHESREALVSIQKLMIGGERLPSSLAAELFRCTTGDLYNMYGPTETTVWSTTYKITGSEDSIPIGWPIGNTHIYILDQQLRPLPIGAPGELCIGGAGVTRGYLNQLELTSEKFPVLVGPAAEERIYRTGDLARYGPLGEIEFLGRIDNQVKILGFRIEVEEIETALGQHPGVLAAAVIPQQTATAEVRLVAYVVSRGNQTYLLQELRIYLQQKLPPHLIPATFVLLDSFPCMPNGKINRKALGALGTLQEKPRKAVSTRADAENVISQIWKDVLGVPVVSTTDNFLDLGANSMLMLDVASRLRDTCNREVAVTDLFRFPTISLLAAHLTDHSDCEPELQRSIGRGQSRKEALLRRSRHANTPKREQ